MRWRIDVLEIYGRLDLDGARDLLDGLDQEIAARTQRVVVRDRAAIGFEHLRVGQLDLLPAHGLDGKHIGLEQVFSGILQQTWITGPSDDALVYLAGLGLVDDFAGHPLFTVVDGEIRDRSRIRKREEVGAFEPVWRVVLEDLLDFGSCNLRVYRCCEFD